MGSPPAGRGSILFRTEPCNKFGTGTSTESSEAGNYPVREADDCHVSRFLLPAPYGF